MALIDARRMSHTALDTLLSESDGRGHTFTFSDAVLLHVTPIVAVLACVSNACVPDDNLLATSLVALRAPRQLAN